MRLLFKKAGGYKQYAVRYRVGREVVISEQIALLIYCLMAYRRVTDDILQKILWPEADTMPDQFRSVYRAQMRNVRKLLHPDGLVIENTYGRGYTMKRANV